MFSPACAATSTNWTGDGKGDGTGFDTAAFTRAGSPHFQSGVERASINVLPSMKREEPRKRRRGRFIDCDDYRDRSLRVAAKVKSRFVSFTPFRGAMTNFLFSRERFQHFQGLLRALMPRLYAQQFQQYVLGLFL